jgi:molybdenum cofactor guanylyltransferase
MRDVFGLILAGGLARRLGGIDKALIEVAGEPILAGLIARLAPQCQDLALNANGDISRFSAFGLPVVTDDVPGFAGPLAGILAGLDYLAANAPHIPYMVSVPVDTPFIPPDLVAGLFGAVARGADITIASSAGRDHHAVALWPLALRADLRRALMDEDLRKVSGFIERYANATVEWPAEPYDPFFNVNRPEDVAEAEKIASAALF